MRSALSSSTARVHLALFLTMVVWGLNLSAVKVLTETLDILLVAAVRMAMAAAVLAFLAWRWGGSAKRWNARGWCLLALAAFFLVYCQQILFASGLARTSATNASLVMALGPTVSLALEAIAFRRAVRVVQMLGVLLALLGVAAVVLNRPHASLTAAASGDFLVLASVVFFALGGLLVQRLTREASPLAVSLVVHVAGAVMLWLHVGISVAAPILQVTSMGGWQWSMAAFSAVLATGIGSVVWSRGIATIGVGQTATYLSWVPIFGVSFGALFLHEPVTAWHVVGLAGVIAGSFLVVYRK
ncbi:MAG: DMT family transporter [Burkholderiales bacterium]|nr:DMT family transporter [Burkholderiales bacterium]